MRKIVNPAHPIPKFGDFVSFMCSPFPEKFAKTNDEAEFLRMKGWNNYNSEVIGARVFPQAK